MCMPEWKEATEKEEERWTAWVVSQSLPARQPAPDHTWESLRPALLAGPAQQPDASPKFVRFIAVQNWVGVLSLLLIVVGLLSSLLWPADPLYHPAYLQAVGEKPVAVSYEDALSGREIYRARSEHAQMIRMLSPSQDPLLIYRHQGR